MSVSLIRSCRALVLALLGLTAVAAASSEAPRRVVSINLCVDQLAILVAADGQLVSVSNLASDERGSMLADRARDFVPNHGYAEEVLLLEPDLVLAGTYTTRATVELLRRLGVRVEELAPAGSFADVRTNLRRLGELLGQGERAESLVTDLDRRLRDAAAQPGEQRLVAALYSANSYTSGPGTLSDAILQAAGLDNAASELGMSGVARLPLEQLVMLEPDLLVAGRRWSTAQARADEIFVHPALAAMGAPRANSFDAHWVCGGPWTAEAVHQLAQARRELLSPGGHGR